MNNQFRKKLEEQEEEEQPRVEEEVQEPVRDSKTIAFLRKFFTEGVITKESATDMLPFLIFVCVLVMIYIANSHMAISNIRKISTLNKEVKELSWEYKSLKADLMFKSKLTEVAKKVDTLGIKELIEPPKKIIIKSNEH
ncbi:FtsL-like putative cell division protein [Pedobacter namyangjuensis]|uniref:FtsL-like putative cell division protein n=1 Tax=Pedobacter namyangjuensis TaxID=600626 RepID=UPI000DE3CF4E|nr:FtsL-like putative cell division protein [Pedobacter namyangjuensis]